MSRSGGGRNRISDPLLQRGRYVLTHQNVVVLPWWPFGGGDAAVYRYASPPIGVMEDSPCLVEMHFVVP